MEPVWNGMDFDIDLIAQGYGMVPLLYTQYTCVQEGRSAVGLDIRMSQSLDILSTNRVWLEFLKGLQMD